jgi:hypothetical protein
MHRFIWPLTLREEHRLGLLEKKASYQGQHKNKAFMEDAKYWIMTTLDTK